MKILFVCLGNINRSIAAEIICKQLAPEHEVKSCALNGIANHSITNKMRTILRQKGYEVPPIQKSTAITTELLEWAEMIICMDRANLRKIYENYNEHLNKVAVMWVKDPNFSKGTYEHVRAAEKIENYIKENLCAG